MDILQICTILFYLMGTAACIGYLVLQKNRLHRGADVLLAAGFAFHTLSLGYGFFLDGHIPVQNLHETLVLAAWALICVYFLFQWRYRLRVLGAFAAPLALTVMLIAYQLPRQTPTTANLFASLWLVGHVAAIFLGESAFALAFGLGLLYLLQERAIKTKNPGFFFKRLPSLEMLDSAGYRCIVAGFALHTLGLITGFIYAKSVWGRFWGWDPKEVWSGVTWLLYAALLHQRLTVGWRGRRAAIMAIIGFIVVLFTFLGVNFLMKGHHGVFTRLGS